MGCSARSSTSTQKIWSHRGIEGLADQDRLCGLCPKLSVSDYVAEPETYGKCERCFKGHGFPERWLLEPAEVPTLQEDSLRLRHGRLRGHPVRDGDRDTLRPWRPGNRAESYIQSALSTDWHPSKMATLLRKWRNQSAHRLFSCPGFLKWVARRTTQPGTHEREDESLAPTQCLDKRVIACLCCAVWSACIRLFNVGTCGNMYCVGNAWPTWRICHFGSSIALGLLNPVV